MSDYHMIRDVMIDLLLILKDLLEKGKEEKSIIKGSNH